MPRTVYLLLTENGGLIYLPRGQEAKTPRYEITDVPDEIDYNEVIRQARRVVLAPKVQGVFRFPWSRITNAEQGRIIRLD